MTPEDKQILKDGLKCIKYAEYPVVEMKNRGKVNEIFLDEAEMHLNLRGENWSSLINLADVKNLYVKVWCDGRMNIKLDDCAIDAIFA